MTEPQATAPGLRLRLFGPFEAQVNGQPLARVHSRKETWLLALLALRSGREVERDWLAATLWPDSHTSRALLRQTLTDLRAALGTQAARLRSPTAHTLALDLTSAEADVLAFDQAVARGDAASLQEAVALYGGPLLEGCTEEWALPERAAREQVYLKALERLAEQAGKQGDPTAAIGWLRRLTESDPLGERAYAALMQALADRGDYAAASQVYRDLRLLLREHLNAEPSADTQALAEQIRTQARHKAEGEKGRVARSAVYETAREEGEKEPVLALPSLLTASPLPTGTLTFLFTDIEGSTDLWEHHAEAMQVALARHDAQLRRAIEQHHGHVFKTLGDGFCAAFPTAQDALAAALAIQTALNHRGHREKDEGEEGQAGASSDSSASSVVEIRVRMALHTGVAEERDGDYFGPTLNRISRLLAITAGGQVLLTSPTEELARESLPAGAGLREMGSHRLKDLQQPLSLYQLTHPSLPAEFPPLKSLSALPTNLPVQLTSFVGREQEMAEVKRLLSSAPLLTLTGSGGCGKTRLALQAAAEVLEAYPEGVWLVELASLLDGSLVPQAVASALGLREEPGRSLTETVTDYLKSKTVLLMLDNCEHLIPACAQLSASLLPHCPHLRLLATSREALGIGGERVYRVPSLSLPQGSGFGAQGSGTASRLLTSDAVRLFVERAAFAQPAFTLSERNAPFVAQVCQRLDGIPLALEMAAARVRVLSVEQIAARLSDVFRLLTGGDRTKPARYQTLRATMEWSYDLLTEEERTLLNRLSVFAGGWTLEAAEAICSGEVIEDWEVLDLLTALVDKSLVVCEEAEGGAPRYRLLETVRQYGSERLEETGETEAVRDRHLDWCLALAEEASKHLQGPDATAWLDRLEREHDNLRAALEFSAEGSVSP